MPSALSIACLTVPLIAVALPLWLLWAGALHDTTPFNVTMSVALVDQPPQEFDVEVHPEWAPRGAERFHELVEAGFFSGVRIFRVEDFVVQWGIHGDPAVSAKWKHRTLYDDPPGKQSNVRGTLAFAAAGRDSRTTQVFMNKRDNPSLDRSFRPFARVVGEAGIELLASRVYRPGDRGSSPAVLSQQRIHEEGNRYLEEKHPHMSFFTGAVMKLREEDHPRDEL